MCHYSDISPPEASSSEGKPIFTKPNECLHMNRMEKLEDNLCNCRRQLGQIGGSTNENRREESESEDQGENIPRLEDELTTDMFNFPHTFLQLNLKRTKSFKHRHDLVSEQSYTVTLKENARTDPNATLGDIHNQLYLMFQSFRRNIQCLHFF